MDQEKRLDSWKEIQNYLNRDVRTLRRWEKNEGLPVHRHSHQSRSSVYAYPSEIDAWRLSRKLAPEPAPPLPGWRRLWRPSFAAALVLCLFLAGSGIRPVSARQSDGKMAARQVWVQTNRETALDISRDGRYAAFEEWGNDDLAVHDFKTGTSRRLTDTKGLASVDDAAISPDGKWIVFLWDQYKDPKFEALTLIPLAGGASRTLWRTTSDPEVMVPLTWTPDGKEILVRHILPDGNRDLALFSVQDASVRKVKSLAKGVNVLAASMSPDGKWIAYGAPMPAGFGNEIFILASDGSRETKAVTGGALPVWSPDGSRIVFNSGRTGKRTLWSIPVADGKPGKEELIRDDIGTWTRMTRSGTLLYQQPAPGGWDIYGAELGPDGKVSQPPVLAVPSFPNGNRTPVLSPDGSSIFYHSDARKASILRTLDTGEERAVALDAVTKTCCGQVQWFPDGSLLGYSDFPRGSGQHFYRTDVSTGKAEFLFDSLKGFRAFALSPDGKSVFFGRDASLIRYDIDTKRETELKNTKSNVAYIRQIAPSLDGKQVAYVVWEENSSSVEVMPAGGGVARVVLPPLANTGGNSYTTASWTPDQRYLLVTQRTGDPAPVVLLRVPVAGGKAEPTGISMRGINGVQVHPDGRRIFFEANDSGPSELWELENFLPKPGGR